ncbi:hypothetical protein [Syntrophomonas curvata]
MALAIFICIFTALYVCFAVEENVGMTMAEITVDNVRTSILRKLNSNGRWEKLNNIQKNAEDFLKRAFIVGILGGALLFLVTLGYLGPYSIVFLLTGIAASVLIAEAAINNAYQVWQVNMVQGIPALIDFLPSFLETPGITTRAALEYTIPFIPGPLREELNKTLEVIKRTGNARRELMLLSSRVRHPVVEAVCTRLATTWDATINPDLFSDLREEVANVQEMAAARATTKKKGLFVVVVLVGILGMGLLAGFPIISNILNSVSSGFGA